MVNSMDPGALQEKMQEVLSDEAFARKLLQMEEDEDVQEALEEKGIELSLDEIRMMSEHVRKDWEGGIPPMETESMTDGELSEEELMDVAGGDNTIIALINWISKW